MHILFPNSSHSVMGYLSLKTQLLSSPKVKWSNDLIKRATLVYLSNI